MSPREAYGGFFPTSRPIRVDGGIKARSTRGSIGQAWWSRRFVDVLESFALGSRMTRGRSYARAGQVISLEVGSGKVTASVQGSRARPYRVTIGLPAFAESVWVGIEATLAEQAVYSARLLAGEVPPDLEQVFADAGAPLFPSKVRELDMRCSCPDFAVPCKHLAATFYLLAESFDADPFQILRWRGRDRQTLLARLRALRESADPGDADADDPASGEAAAADPASGGADADDPTSGDAAAGASASGASASGASASGAPAPGDAAAGGVAGSADGGVAESAAGRGIGARAVVGELAVVGEPANAPLVDCADRFWQAPQPLPARPPTFDGEPDLLLRQLAEPGAALGGAELLVRLREGYLRFDPPVAG